MNNAMRRVLALRFGGQRDTVPDRIGVVAMTFNGFDPFEEVLGYYNGGLGFDGSGPGPCYGVVFGDSAVALSGANHANNPSPPGALAFLIPDGAVMNVAEGFTAGFAFFYSAAVAPAVVRIFDGLDATGNLLAELDLPVTPTIPPGPRYNNWAPVGARFDGVARSVDFSAACPSVVFDNLTLGSAVPWGVVSDLPSRLLSHPQPSPPSSLP